MKNVYVCLLTLLILPITFQFAEAEAANAKDSEAKCDQAKQYLNGEGVAQNANKAFKLYKQAALAGSARAQNELGNFYRKGTAVESNCNEAVKWYKKSISQNYPGAMYNLGQMYHSGACGTKDVDKSLNLFIRCAKLGTVECMKNTAGVYYKDLNDVGNAFKWMFKAAEAGDVESQCSVGLCYYDGDCAPRNSQKGLFWLRKAASQGDQDAIQKLQIIRSN